MKSDVTEACIRGEETDTSDNAVVDPVLAAVLHNGRSKILEYKQIETLVTSSLSQGVSKGASSQCENVVEGSPLKAKKKGRAKRLVMNVGTTKYAVVKHVAQDLLGYKLSTREDSDWDIYWTDTYVTPALFTNLRGYERINHFLGMENLGKKNQLAKNLNQMQKQLAAEYQFYPRTWLLPEDMAKLRAAYAAGTTRVFISKPEAASQGKGIYLSRSLEDFKPGQRCVVQEYIEHPLLIDGLKFDMRIYVLLAGCDPMRVYVYDKGIARFATVPYESPQSGNLQNCFMHLTNYAINKRSPVFTCVGEGDNSTSGHKRSLSAVWTYLRLHGLDPASIRREINQIIVKTICAAQPALAHLLRTTVVGQQTSRTCFEVLGFDIMLDQTGRPWLLEVNHTPSFSTDTKFDVNLKEQLIRDVLQLVQVTPQHKSHILWQESLAVRQRLFGHKSSPKRFKHLQLPTVSGGFTLICPSEDCNFYRYINVAEDIFTRVSRTTRINRATKYNQSTKSAGPQRPSNRQPAPQRSRGLYSPAKPRAWHKNRSQEAKVLARTTLCPIPSVVNAGIQASFHDYGADSTNASTAGLHELKLELAPSNNRSVMERQETDKWLPMVERSPPRTSTRVQRLAICQRLSEVIKGKPRGLLPFLHNNHFLRWPSTRNGRRSVSKAPWLDYMQNGNDGAERWRSQDGELLHIRQVQASSLAHHNPSHKSRALNLQHAFTPIPLSSYN